MQLEDSLKEIIEFHNFTVPINKYGMTVDTLIFYLVEDYSLTKVFKGNNAALSKFLSQLFPNRPKTRNNIKQWLLSLANLKYCPYCYEVKQFEEFDINSNKGPQGLNAYCKPCNLLAHGKEYYTNYEAKRKAEKLLRSPGWANLDKISRIYKDCPEGMEVDHIIPLRGSNVSGLHVENNLQYLSKSDNCIKSNTWVVS